MKRTNRAYTLVEILIVSSLIAVVSLAVFRSFSNGLKLWGRAERLNNEADVAILFDKMAEDLKSVSLISGIPFKGTGTKVSFPTIVLTKADPRSSRAQEELVDQIGAVQYRFDAESHRVFRRQANYSQATKEKWVQEELPVASGIDDLILHYEVISDKGFLLKSEVNATIPGGVMVEVHFSDDSGPHQLKRYLSIPVGE
jgi:prepilin-type N-terminal cleavage/methylation domain-containing protein